jgi:hypothetical protein
MDLEPAAKIPQRSVATRIRRYAGLGVLGVVGATIVVYFVLAREEIAYLRRTEIALRWTVANVHAQKASHGILSELARGSAEAGVQITLYDERDGAVRLEGYGQSATAVTQLVSRLQTSVFVAIDTVQVSLAIDAASKTYYSFLIIGKLPALPHSNTITLPSFHDRLEASAAGSDVTLVYAKFSDAAHVEATGTVSHLNRFFKSLGVVSIRDLNISDPTKAGEITAKFEVVP